MNARSLALAVAVCLSWAIPRGASGRGILADGRRSDQVFPRPAGSSSPEAREELELMESIQHDRTKEDVDRFALEVDLTLDAFKSVLGPWCTAENLPKLAQAVQERLRTTRSRSAMSPKIISNVRGPPQEDPQLHVPIQNETTFAYPSGHSSAGRCMP